MPFGFKKLEMDELMLIEPYVFEDDRGYFMETYKMSDFAKAGITQAFVQDNHSWSRRGVLRGLHYQKPPFAQGKLVRAIKGEIFDAVIDIRKGSSTFGKWLGVTLTEDNKNMLYIPEGFAHGFVVLSDIAEVVYKTTSPFCPESEAGIIWSDGDLKVDWPIDKPILSDKDNSWPTLREAFQLNQRKPLPSVAM